ncbi:MAG TPA: hypothetical protein VL401_00600 [Alphaproteobacteria bacterium]|nr:hypothetical protein [Alphaproteobacteria bacterium]
MSLFTKSSFLITLSDLLVNLAAGWFGIILILPGIWQTSNFENSVIIILNLFYGIMAFLLSILIKDLNYGN